MLSTTFYEWTKYSLREVKIMLVLFIVVLFVKKGVFEWFWQFLFSFFRIHTVSCRRNELVGKDWFLSTFKLSKLLIFYRKRLYRNNSPLVTIFFNKRLSHHDPSNAMDWPRWWWEGRLNNNNVTSSAFMRYRRLR